VRLIVPLAPGGPTDLTARLLGEPLSRIWGQQVVIENKPGAGDNLAAETVARSDPDGYTILYATSSLAVNRGLYRTLTYDPVADFAPIIHLTSFPYFMFVPNSLAAHSVREFIALAKARKLTLASPGSGTAPHLTGELFLRMAGIEMTQVPYRGAWPVRNDLIPGRVDAYFASGALLENMRAGQIRGLAVTGSRREPAAPELPTMAEAGVPGFEASSWHGLFVPARTPAPIVRKINTNSISALGGRRSTRKTRAKRIWHCRLEPGRARSVAQGRDRQVELGHQARRHQVRLIGMTVSSEEAAWEGAELPGLAFWEQAS